MKNDLMRKTILLAIIFALLAGVFTYMYLAELEAKYRTMAEPVKVITANQRIPQGTIIKKNMLGEKVMPKEYIQPKVFTNAESLFTKDGTPAYISLNTIEAGEQILSSKVSLTGSDIGIANIIPEGKKALAVNFDSESSSIIKPGSTIDILSIIDYADNNKQYQESVHIIAQNILVLAVGSDYIGAPRSKDSDNSQRSPVITLSVTVEEAQTILLASDKGTLKYIIRPAGETEINDIKPLKISNIINDISTDRQNSSARQSSSSLNKSQKEALELINKYVAEGR